MKKRKTKKIVCSISFWVGVNIIGLPVWVDHYFEKAQHIERKYHF